SRPYGPAPGRWLEKRRPGPARDRGCAGRRRGPTGRDVGPTLRTPFRPGSGRSGAEAGRRSGRCPGRQRRGRAGAAKPRGDQRQPWLETSGWVATNLVPAGGRIGEKKVTVKPLSAVGS